VNINWTWVSRS